MSPFCVVRKFIRRSHEICKGERMKWADFVIIEQTLPTPVCEWVRFACSPSTIFNLLEKSTWNGGYFGTFACEIAEKTSFLISHTWEILNRLHRIVRISKFIRVIFVIEVMRRGEENQEFRWKSLILIVFNLTLTSIRCDGWVRKNEPISFCFCFFDFQNDRISELHCLWRTHLFECSQILFEMRYVFFSFKLCKVQLNWIFFQVLDDTKIWIETEIKKIAENSPFPIKWDWKKTKGRKLVILSSCSCNLNW